MSEHHFAVILAGGKGERFWPLSTSACPKQLLSLVGDKPLLAQAVDRLEGLIPPERVFVLTNADLVEGCRKACPNLPEKNIVGEPVGRDTAAAVALAAALVKAADPEGVFCILTADHVIRDLEDYHKVLDDALTLAGEQAVLITIGIEPQFPSTGFGYIEAGEPFPGHEGRGILRSKRFVEKPDAPTAQSYLDAGTFYWNSGMFIWSVDAIEKAFTSHHPALADFIPRIAGVAGTDQFEAVLAEAFGQLEKISIDYAVMEKADNILMAKGTFYWDDVGSWTALSNHFPLDPSHNTLVGDAEIIDASDNVVVSREHLTALVGVNDLIVVQAPGVTLICSKEHAQDVKKLVQQVRERPGGDKLV